ncbi:MAG: hypothetical protein RR646_01880 [Erysipelotrichaceae bacterium]
MYKVMDLITMNNVNMYLKKQGIEYSLHTVGSCACNGVYLRCDGTEHNLEEILILINEFIKDKFIKLESNKEDPFLLNIV